MSLNLFTLKVFLMVAKELSFTKAAQGMFISQPAVSLHIQKLEQLFQTQLFIRPASGSIRLTPAGKTLMEYAEKMTQLQNDIFSGMAEHSPVLQREIRIGTCCTAGEYLMQPGMDSFRQAHPEIPLSLYVTKCEEVLEGLLKGDFDIGITGQAPKSRAFSKTLLIKTRMLLFEARTGCREPRRLSVKDIQNQRLILREKSAGCRIEFNTFLVQHGVHLRDIKVSSESESNEMIIKLVKKGYGISILPEFMVRHGIDNDTLSAIDLCEGQPTQSFFIINAKQTPPSPLAQELVALLKKHATAPVSALYAE